MSSIFDTSFIARNESSDSKVTIGALYELIAERAPEVVSDSACIKSAEFVEGFAGLTVQVNGVNRKFNRFARDFIRNVAGVLSDDIVYLYRYVSMMERLSGSENFRWFCSPASGWHSVEALLLASAHARFAQIYGYFYKTPTRGANRYYRYRRVGAHKLPGLAERSCLPKEDTMSLWSCMVRDFDVFELLNGKHDADILKFAVQSSGKFARGMASLKGSEDAVSTYAGVISQSGIDCRVPLPLPGVKGASILTLQEDFVEGTVVFPANTVLISLPLDNTDSGDCCAVVSTSVSGKAFWQGGSFRFDEDYDINTVFAPTFS